MRSGRSELGPAATVAGDGVHRPRTWAFGLSIPVFAAAVTTAALMVVGVFSASLVAAVPGVGCRELVAAGQNQATQR